MILRRNYWHLDSNVDSLIFNCLLSSMDFAFPFMSFFHVDCNQKGELPAGRAAVSLNTVFPYRESEIEEELNELRRKAKDV